MTPQDVKTAGPDVLRHRIIVSYEAEAEEVTSETIIETHIRGAAGARKSTRPRDRASCIRERARIILRKIRHVELKTRGLVAATFAGQYRSVFKGRGMNFEEVREYRRGTRCGPSTGTSRRGSARCTGTRS